MHDGPSFTVIIPTYNYGRFLGRAIDSVLSQTVPAAQIVVVDDGSTDDTPAVAARYAGRIEFIRQTNAGVAAARNAGLDQARGDYVLFLDADDRLLPGSLGVLRQTIADAPHVGLVFGRYVSLKGDGTRHESRRLPAMRSRAGNFRRFIARRFSISNGTAAIRRELFDHVRYPVGITHGEDVVVHGQILALCDAVSLSVPIAEIVAHGDQARTNFARILANGTTPVDALFRSEILPPELMAYRPRFESRWLAELSRAAFRNGDFAAAERYYRQAVAADWRTLFDGTRFVQYLRSRMRRRVSRYLGERGASAP